MRHKQCYTFDIRANHHLPNNSTTYTELPWHRHIHVSLKMRQSTPKWSTILQNTLHSSYSELITLLLLYQQVNKQLDKMGYNIGVRLIEDFLAHSPSTKRCTQLEEAADVLAKQGFRMFLGLLESWRHC